MDVKEIRERIEYVLSINPQMVMDGSKKSGDPYAISYNYKMVLHPIIDALSTLDPEAQGQAANVGKYFCAAMPCSPSDCGEVPCQYMRDAISNRNNRDPEAIKRTVLLDAIKSISILNQMSVESSINDDYLIGYGFGVRDCQIKLESILQAEPGQEKNSNPA